MYIYIYIDMYIYNLNIYIYIYVYIQRYIGTHRHIYLYTEHVSIHVGHVGLKAVMVLYGFDKSSERLPDLFGVVYSKIRTCIHTYSYIRA